MHSADLPSFRHCSHNHRDSGGCGWGLGKYANAHSLTATPLVAEATAAATAIKYAKDGKAHKKTKRTNERRSESRRVRAPVSFTPPSRPTGLGLPSAKYDSGNIGLLRELLSGHNAFSRVSHKLFVNKIERGFYQRDSSWCSEWSKR